ncbi:SWIM zinc finger family protein [Streptomyces sp. YIM 130001]|uniref:SWIM zinc finger family protein n=1 Tax=Streptomyces sp. YIM 130001 TaxID=2259644 RepID=UPI003204CC56
MERPAQRPPDEAVDVDAVRERRAAGGAAERPADLARRALKAALRDGSATDPGRRAAVRADASVTAAGDGEPVGAGADASVGGEVVPPDAVGGALWAAGTPDEAGAGGGPRDATGAGERADVVTGAAAEEVAAPRPAAAARAAVAPAASARPEDGDASGARSAPAGRTTATSTSRPGDVAREALREARIAARRRAAEESGVSTGGEATADADSGACADEGDGRRGSPAGPGSAGSQEEPEAAEGASSDTPDDSPAARARAAIAKTRKGVERRSAVRPSTRTRLTPPGADDDVPPEGQEPRAELPSVDRRPRDPQGDRAAGPLPAAWTSSGDPRHAADPGHGGSRRVERMGGLLGAAGLTDAAARQPDSADPSPEPADPSPEPAAPASAQTPRATAAAPDKHPRHTSDEQHAVAPVDAHHAGPGGSQPPTGEPRGAVVASDGRPAPEDPAVAGPPGDTQSQSATPASELPPEEAHLADAPGPGTPDAPRRTGTDGPAPESTPSLTDGAAPRADRPPTASRRARAGTAPDANPPFARTWWGNAWVQALESQSMDAGRLARGRAYEGQGQVAAVTVAPGQVIAYVQGSRPRPYRTKVQVRVLSDDEWERFLQIAVERPGHIAALLDKELPQSLADCGVDLLPGRGDLRADCSCPDSGHPCKHAAALCYRTARLLDEDPFVLLRLRGREERELLDELSRRNATLAARAAAGAPARPAGVRAKDAFAPRVLPLPPPPLPVPAHPEAPPVYPAAAGGPDPIALDQLATDAAARAHALLAKGADPVGELTPRQDAVRIAAARPGSGLTAAGRALYESLAPAVGLTPAELARAVAAWRQGGIEGLAVLDEPWDPPAGPFDQARPALMAADLPAFRPWRNRLTHPAGRRQLRFGRDGRWYAYESEAGRDDWWPRGTPDHDPVGAITAVVGT